jgi:predicted HAD superfamily Cof-like phosphohydrolase
MEGVNGMSQWQDIKDFHEKFGLVYDGPPRSLPEDLGAFRTNFLIEETDEYILAEKRADQLDALVDLVYVAMGTAYLHGYNFDEAWRRVHKANMAKIRGPSARSDKYDLLKPEGWQAPDHGDLVGEAS